VTIKLHHRRRVLASGLAGMAALCLPLNVAAHRQRRALTTIKWNERTHVLEITHALHLHDAEQALTRLGNLEAPDLTPLRARAQLALYTKKHFKLTDMDNTAIEATILGAEIESGYAYVFLEAGIKKKPSGLIITDTILQDIFVDQVNVVNIDFGGDTKTATFLIGDKAKKLLA